MWHTKSAKYILGIGVALLAAAPFSCLIPSTKEVDTGWAGGSFFLVGLILIVLGFGINEYSRYIEQENDNREKRIKK